MDDLNNDILDYSENYDLFPISSSLENEDIYHNGLSIQAQYDLFNENELPLDDDLNSIQHCNYDCNHVLGVENNIPIHHESIGLPEHKSVQISFTGIYNDAEIKHFEDEVNKYKYEVNHLKDELHHNDDMVDLSKGKRDYNFEISQRDKTVSDLNYAIDKLNDAQERLNNAT